MISRLIASMAATAGVAAVLFSGVPLIDPSSAPAREDEPAATDLAVTDRAATARAGAGDDDAAGWFSGGGRSLYSDGVTRSRSTADAQALRAEIESIRRELDELRRESRRSRPADGVRTQPPGRERVRGGGSGEALYVPGVRSQGGRRGLAGGGAGGSVPDSLLETPSGGGAAVPYGGGGVYVPYDGGGAAVPYGRGGVYVPYDNGGAAVPHSATGVPSAGADADAGADAILAEVRALRSEVRELTKIVLELARRLDVSRSGAADPLPGARGRAGGSAR